MMLSSRSFLKLLAVCLLSFSLLACVGKTTKRSQPELTTEIIARVKGGKGSGVVGGPVAGALVTACLAGKTLGPITTDSSGTFTLDVFDLLPAGTPRTVDGLRSVAPVAIDLRFFKEGFKTQTEVITIPFPKTQELEFSLSGE